MAMGDAVARGGNVELLPVDDGSIVALQKRCNNILGCDLATNRRQAGRTRSWRRRMRFGGRSDIVLFRCELLFWDHYPSTTTTTHRTFSHVTNG